MKTPPAAAALLWAALICPAAAADWTFVSAERPPHLLELYTSEGCSSCPPAELWFGVLESEPALWKSFVPVAFHVDYWDYIGWKDRLGSKKYSLRQRMQAGSGRVYTPGFFLNGAEWRGWFEGEALPPADAPAVGVLSVSQVRPGEFVVDFKPKRSDQGPFDVNGALLGMDIEIPVAAGENRGSKLSHDFAVVGFKTTRMNPSGGRFTATVALGNDTQVKPPRRAAAFWVTRPDSYRPVQAVGGFLAEAEESR